MGRWMGGCMVGGWLRGRMDGYTCVFIEILGDLMELCGIVNA